jgi:hypothetical protein
MVVVVACLANKMRLPDNIASGLEVFGQWTASEAS